MTSAPQSNYPHFTDPELVMLSLANSGEFLIKCPVTEALAERGFMRAADPVNYTITDEGRSALAAVAEQEAKEQSDAFNGVSAGHKIVQQLVRHAAKTMALAAQASHELTGDGPEAALELWLGSMKVQAVAELRKPRP